MTLGVSLAAVNNTLQVYLGSLYVNDFNLFGRTWQVIVQADATFRNQVDQLRLLKVRNNDGAMVPLGTLTDIRAGQRAADPHPLQHVPAAAVTGSTGPGVSSRQAIDMMDRLADRELPPSMVCEWTEMAYLEIQAGNTAMAVFGLAVVDGVSRAGRPVRKLVAAAGRHSRGADVPAQRGRRRDGGARRVRAPAKVSPLSRFPGPAPVRHQHLHPDRLRRPGGPGQQERDLDRRVRQARRARRARRGARRPWKPAASACGPSS